MWREGCPRAYLSRGAKEPRSSLLQGSFAFYFLFSEIALLPEFLPRGYGFPGKSLNEEGETWSPFGDMHFLFCLSNLVFSSVKWELMW